MRRGLVLILLVVVLAVPAAAQVSSWWAVFVGDPTQRPSMLLFGPYRTQLECTAALPELAKLNPEAMKQLLSGCRSALDLARMLLAP